jgi:iron uptake system component EfeO
MEGSRIAFDLVRDIAERKGEEGAELVATIDEEYDELEELLAEYGSVEDGFVDYDTVTAEQQAELTQQIDELREPLSELTGTVLGIEE